MNICLCVILLPLTRWFVFSFMLVCLLVRLQKNYLADCTKFDGKVAHGAWKKPLDFGGNQDRVPLKSRVIVKVRSGAESERFSVTVGL